MTDNVSLFPLADYWWFYGGFTSVILLFLALDLGVFHRKAHAVGTREAGIWCVVWIASALIFNVLFYYFALHQFQNDARLLAIPGFDPALQAWDVALSFLTGYVVEKSLSVDNVFVFAVVFSYFSVPEKYQHRVLFFGILGALIFRTIFISLGSVLMQYAFVETLFGIFLAITGLKVLFAPEKPLEPEKNPAIRFLRRYLPISASLDGQNFFTVENGVRCATPLLLVLVFIEITDIIFALDSVPAIFAITDEALIVFTSNIFAILGLRAMYFLLSSVMHKFRFLKVGLGFILLWVSLKMIWLNDAFGGHFPVGWSLLLIVAILSVSIAASFYFPEKEKE